MRTLCIIPARSGSKRCPGKNWEKVGGKTLLQRAVDSAPYPSRVMVVTDAPERCQDVFEYPARRDYVSVVEEPAKLAADDVSMVDVVTWAIKEADDDKITAVILLQPTSPLRNYADVHVPLSLLKRTEADSVVSVVGVKEGKHVRYEHNGAVYVFRPEVAWGGSLVGGFTQFYVMPPERSIDIDTPEDLAEARRLAGDANG